MTVYLDEKNFEDFIHSWIENPNKVMANYPITVGDIRQLIRKTPVSYLDDLVAAVKGQLYMTDNVKLAIVTTFLNGMVFGASYP